MNDRITAALKKANTVENTVNEDISTNTELEPSNIITEDSSKIITTQEELDGFAIIKAILYKTIPVNKIYYRDTVSYFGILYDNKNYKWICRLKVEKAIKYIILPDGTNNGKKYPLATINSIFDYADEIIESAKRFVEDEIID